MATIWFWFLVLLLLLAIFAWPVWPYTRVFRIYQRSGHWPYVPSGVAFTIALILLLLFWLGWILVAIPWG